MGIKRNTTIIAEVLAVKPSRLQAAAAMQQAERLLRDDIRPERPAKPKAGKQAQRGRVRVDRARPAIVTAQRVLQLEDMLAEMATREILEDERGYAYCVSPEVGLRWKHPAKFVCGIKGFYSFAVCWLVPTIEGLMAFEDELIDQHALPRGYVTPDEIVAITGRRLGK